MHLKHGVFLFSIPHYSVPSGADPSMPSSLRVKAYIHREGSAYRRVLETMKRLLDAEIGISVRLNMDLHTAENLLELADELGREFAGRKGLSVYAHHLFEGDKPLAESHDEDGWNLRHEAMGKLRERIARNGLSAAYVIRNQPKQNRCMADSGRSVMIQPVGCSLKNSWSL